MPTKSKSKESKSKASKNSKNKVKIGLVIGAIAVALIAAIVVVIILASVHKSTSDKSDEMPDYTEQISFDQNITDENGNTFKSTYELGTKSNFSIRFTDLTCTTACENVQSISLGDKTLIRGKDYEVKAGSIIIIIFASTLEALEAGQYNLVLQVTAEDDNLISVGVKITITAAQTPTCNEGQTLENGQCVSKKDESTDNSNNTSNSNPSSTEPTKPNTPPSSSQPTQSTTPSKTEQQLCEEKTAPYRVLTITWLTEAEKAQYKEIFPVDPSDPDRAGFEDGDEIAISGSGYSGAKMKWVNGKCQVDLSAADPIGMGGGDWLYPRSHGTFPNEIRSNPNRNAVIWYFSDGNHQTDFVNGDPWGYINSLM